VIFCVTPQPFHHDSGVDLPTVTNARPMPHATNRDAIVLMVTRDGKIFAGAELLGAVGFGNIPMSDRLRQDWARTSDKRIYIKADARARYRWVRHVLAEIETAGIQNVVFLVEQKRSTLPN